MKTPVFILAAILTALAGPAAADDRYYAYDAEGPAARHRTGDVTVQVSRSLLRGTRLVQLFRRRGDDLPLTRADGDFNASAVAALTGAEGWAVYAVETTAGRGFAQGACVGADRAWIAAATPERFRPLRLVVLARGEGGQPRLCETLTYSWRAEWDLPNRRRGTTEDPRPAPRAF